jgi:hypothetical protein
MPGHSMVSERSFCAQSTENVHLTPTPATGEAASAPTSRAIWLMESGAEHRPLVLASRGLGTGRV